MSNMMSGGMLWGMGLFWLLVTLCILLGLTVLVIFLFSTRGQMRQGAGRITLAASGETPAVPFLEFCV